MWHTLTVETHFRKKKNHGHNRGLRLSLRNKFLIDVWVYLGPFFYLSNWLLQKSYAFPVRDHVVHLEINIGETLYI